MENALFIAAAVLTVVAIIAFVIYIIVLKKQIRDMKKQLSDTKELSYNKQIQIQLIDKDLEALAAEINKNIDYQKGLKLEYESSERQLKQSISDIAHDLRTPLTVIKGNLQLLEQSLKVQRADIDETTNEVENSQLEYIKICQNKAEILKQMIDEFFEMSVLESDIDEVPLQTINATNLLMQFVVDHEALIREKELTPNINLPDKTVMLKGDASFIGRMLSNLLNNILKYGREAFEVGLIEEDKQVVIYFSNEVDKSVNIDVDRLFDRTYRADIARNEGSAGLGLYIVKVLALKQGGSVGASMEGRNLLIKLIFQK